MYLYFNDLRTKFFSHTISRIRPTELSKVLGWVIVTASINNTQSPMTQHGLAFRGQPVKIISLDRNPDVI